MLVVDRRKMLAGLTSLGAMVLLPRTAGAAQLRFGPKQPFSWALLQRRAADLAKQAHRETPPSAGADAIGYDAVQKIAYRPDATLARGIRLFPVQRIAPQPVAIHIVEGAAASPVIVSPDLFSASGDVVPAAGAAGFRVMTAGGNSDWLAFLGASYFRAAGSQDQYGLSARAVAVNTGVDGPEEFPAFTNFWIEPRGDAAYIIYALLDGPSITGAFRFDSRLTPDGVVQDVSSVLTLRRDVQRLGIAPATSMFWYGEGNRAGGIDWRPEIHDSDGLAMLNGSGERIWRPLTNPPRSHISSFADEAPKGFGLMQRDRGFDHYQDDGAFYERRPNLWVEPQGRWGKGAVTLYEFPTRGETVDNIVAFWVPAAPAKRGRTFRFDYRMTWTSTDPSAGKTARAVDCWTGTAGRPGADPTPGARKLVVDFEGPGLAGLDRGSGVTADIGAERGRILGQAAYPVVGQSNRWRVMADLAPVGAEPIDVRIHLRRGEDALSETVLFQMF